MEYKLADKVRYKGREFIVAGISRIDGRINYLLFDKKRKQAVMVSGDLEEVVNANKK